MGCAERHRARAAWGQLQLRVAAIFTSRNDRPDKYDRRHRPPDLGQGCCVQSVEPRVGVEVRRAAWLNYFVDMGTFSVPG